MIVIVRAGSVWSSKGGSASASVSSGENFSHAEMTKQIWKIAAPARKSFHQM